MTTTEPAIRLNTLLARNARTEPLFKGEIASNLVSLDLTNSVMPVTAGFPSMVRDMPYDFGELALLTFLQAREAGKPFTLLPFVLAADFLHRYMHYNSAHGTLKPSDLAGKRIGVRSFTQTTGLWLRGFLEEDYGIALEKQHWVCFQNPHVVEYREPEFVERAPADKNLLQMLLDGEIDAAVGLAPDITAANPTLKPVFPEGAGEEWSKRTGIVPINHMPVLKAEIHRRSPELAPELFRMLVESKRVGENPPALPELRPYGIDPNRRGMELLVRWGLRQQLLREPIPIDELFDPITARLGA